MIAAEAVPPDLRSATDATPPQLSAKMARRRGLAFQSAREAPNSRA